MKTVIDTKKLLPFAILIIAFWMTGCSQGSSRSDITPEKQETKPPVDQSQTEPDIKWVPVVLDEKVVKDYLEYNTDTDPKSAIYSLYLWNINKALDHAEDGYGKVTIRFVDDNTAVSNITYRDGSVDQVKLIKDPKRQDRWFPIESRTVMPNEYEERFAIITYKEGTFYYDEAEWVTHDQKDRIKELQALGVKDMGFENGYYVYNEKNEPIPFDIGPDTKIYLLDPSFTLFQEADADLFQKNVEKNVFNGYYDIYLKEGKIYKLFQVYTP
ncbi:MAG: hypothetical protein Q4A75_08100 [Peptostreptococcaceae bacterium]|nr:hypothetical protein [Peptostreptococcaceae bacterium]